MTFITINFNTNFLANCLFRSIQKNFKTDDYSFCLIEKSTNDKFVRDKHIEKDIKIISNLNKELFDEDAIVEKYGADLNIERNLKTRTSAHASMRHAIGIQWILDNFEDDDEIVLCDTDVVLKKDLDFLSKDRKNYLTIAKLHQDKFGPDEHWEPRFHPCLQYFNLDLYRKSGIRYFDGIRFRESKNKDYNWWDTGASFTHDVIKTDLPYKTFDLKKYAIHFGRASWLKSAHEKGIEKFRNKYNRYYE